MGRFRFILHPRLATSFDSLLFSASHRVRGPSPCQIQSPMPSFFFPKMVPLPHPPACYLPPSPSAVPPLPSSPAARLLSTTYHWLHPNPTPPPPIKAIPHCLFLFSIPPQNLATAAPAPPSRCQIVVAVVISGEPSPSPRLSLVWFAAETLPHLI